MITTIFLDPLNSTIPFNSVFNEYLILSTLIVKFVLEILSKISGTLIPGLFDTIDNIDKPKSLIFLLILFGVLFGNLFGDSSL